MARAGTDHPEPPRVASPALLPAWPCWTPAPDSSSSLVPKQPLGSAEGHWEDQGGFQFLQLTLH